MLSIIVSLAENNAIGCDNSLLVRIPTDLKRFKQLTMNKTIIMGKNTFESLPGLLPNRNHVVITRNPDELQKKYSNDEIRIVSSIDEAINKYVCTEEESFIIGGGSVYTQTLSLADKLYITYIHKNFTADTFFPEIDSAQWEAVFRSDHMTDAKTGIFFNYVDYIRRR